MNAILSRLAQTSSERRGDILGLMVAVKDCSPRRPAARVRRINRVGDEFQPQTVGCGMADEAGVRVNHDPAVDPAFPSRLPDAVGGPVLIRSGRTERSNRLPLAARAQGQAPPRPQRGLSILRPL